MTAKELYEQYQESDETFDEFIEYLMENKKDWVEEKIADLVDVILNYSDNQIPDSSKLQHIHKRMDGVDYYRISYLDKVNVRDWYEKFLENKVEEAMGDAIDRAYEEQREVEYMQHLEEGE